MNKLLLSVFAFTTTAATAQSFPLQGPTIFQRECWDIHLSQLPPTAVDCQLIGTFYNVMLSDEIITTVVDEEFVVTLKGQCTTWECGFPPLPQLANCGYGETGQRCWKVTGDLEFELKWALLARIGPTIGFGGELSDCSTRQYNASLSNPVYACSEVDCVISSVTTTKRVTGHKYSEVADWLCEMPQGYSIPLGTQCNELQSGTAEVEIKQNREIRYSLPRPLEGCDPSGSQCFENATNVEGSSVC